MLKAYITEVYLGPFQTHMNESFTKIVNDEKLAGS